MRRARLGEICTIEKGTTGINKAIPGKYPLVVTSEERKSHNEYQFDADAVVIPLVSSTGHGHKSLKRIHFQTGKFAIGSILCAVIPKDKNQLSAEYLYRYLDLNRENELVARMKGMANVTLPIKEIEQVEIPLPTLDQQHEFVKSYKILENKSSELSSELTHQLALVKQLRQAFLREAMQGKLVLQDANDEPASELLKKIRAEKEQLIKEKKIKKDKELPPIKPDEIPFEIPKSWVWCRVGVLLMYSEAGRSFKCEEVPITDSQWGVIKVSAVSWDKFLEDQNKLYSKQKPKDTSAQIKVDDFLISRANTSELVGKSVIVENLTKNLLLSDKTIRLHFSKSVSKNYVNMWNNAWFARKYYAEKGTGSSPSMKNITREQMKDLVIPVPPMFEQLRIVNKLKDLMRYCDHLEQSIRQSQTQNEQLLKQVLREALQPKKEYKVNNNVILVPEL
jgi:type I restriction enzyme S subunit